MGSHFITWQQHHNQLQSIIMTIDRWYVDTWNNMFQFSLNKSTDPITDIILTWLWLCLTANQILYHHSPDSLFLWWSVTWAGDHHTPGQCDAGHNIIDTLTRASLSAVITNVSTNITLTVWVDISGTFELKDSYKYRYTRLTLRFAPLA